MFTFKVIATQRLTYSTLLLTIQNSNPDKPFQFLPGQYAGLSFRRHGRPSPIRCFSIVSSPIDNEIVQFAIQINGRFTKALSHVEQGEEIKVYGPFGDFTVDEKTDKNIIMLAGGIGITPFLSIIRYLLRINSASKLTLLFSAKDDFDMPFVEELVTLEQNNRNFKLVILSSNSKNDRYSHKKIFKRRIDKKILDLITGRLYLNKSYFVCGSKAFMDGMTGLLKSAGVTDAHINAEGFNGNTPFNPNSTRNWPHLVYGFSALGMIIGSAIIMGADFVRSMPTVSFSSQTTNALVQPEADSSLAGQNLGQTVTSLPPQPAVAGPPVTPAGR